MAFEKCEKMKEEISIRVVGRDTATLSNSRPEQQPCTASTVLFDLNLPSNDKLSSSPSSSLRLVGHKNIKKCVQCIKPKHNIKAQKNN